MASKRIKNAIKCLLGKPIYVPATSHEYKINVEEVDQFSDMVAMVTGGTGAIGSAICYDLASRGAVVGMCGRSKEKIDRQIDYIAKQSPSVASKKIPVLLDVNDDNQIEESICDFTKKFGRLDVFVNNAGGQPGNVGKSVDIMSDYAASKAGVIGFTKSFALELADKNIRVDCISPGYVNQVPFDCGSPKSVIYKTALGRAGFTSEVSSAVMYLVQNKFVTGENAVVAASRNKG